MTKPAAASHEITGMLRAWSEGKAEVLDDLFPLIYAELHRQASLCLRRERADHTLQTTALVHEAYLKLIGQRSTEWNCRDHFFAVAAQFMRRILVDYARGRGREKRGGPKDDLPLEEALLASAGAANIDIVALDEALARLARIDPQQERIVELRYFGGLSLDETARALNISRSTAARDWQVAKAWLFREMTR